MEKESEKKVRSAAKRMDEGLIAVSRSSERQFSKLALHFTEEIERAVDEVYVYYSNKLTLTKYILNMVSLTTDEYMRIEVLQNKSYKNIRLLEMKQKKFSSLVRKKGKVNSQTRQKR
jgi:hypothetical protein